MKKQYIVYIRDVEVKRYQYEIQAIIYCFLNGYVYSGRGLYFLHPDVRIEKSYSLSEHLKRKKF